MFCAHTKSVCSQRKQDESRVKQVGQAISRNQRA